MAVGNLGLELNGVSRELLVSLVATALDKGLNDVWAVSKRLPFEAEDLRDASLNCVRAFQLGSRETADTLAAWGSEVFTDEKGQFQDTAFRMVRSGDSAGQGLPDYALKLAARCTAEDIDAALSGLGRIPASCHLSDGILQKIVNTLCKRSTLARNEP